MAIHRLWNVVVRRWGVFVLLFLVTLCSFVRVTSPPDTKQYAATTSVLIGPDPWVLPREDALVPAPTYWSFQAKMRSLRERPVLRRAAELMRGDRSFSSSLFQGPDVTPRIEAFREQYSTLHSKSTLESEARYLAARLSLRQQKRAQLVSLSIRDTSDDYPVFASWALADAALQIHAERVLTPVRDYLRALRTTLARIEVEVASARTVLATEEARHRPGFRQRWVSVRKARTEISQELDDAIEVYESTRIESREAKQALAKRRSHAQSREATWLADQLFDARQHLAALSQLSPDHPEARRASRRVELLAARLRSIPGDGDRLTADSERAHATLVQFQAIELRRAVLTKRFEELDREAMSLGASMAAVRPFERALAEAETTQARYQRLRARLETGALWKTGPVAPYEVARSSVPVAHPSLPSRWWWAVIIACLVGAGGVSLREYTDSRVHTSDRLIETIGLTPLAVVPTGGRSEWSDLGTDIAASLYPVESLIERRSRTHGLKSFVITSPRQGDGKSTIARVLAYRLALRGKRVALVDADLRSCNPDTTGGLAELIVGSLGSRISSVGSSVQVMERSATATQSMISTPHGYDLLPRGGAHVSESQWPHVAHRLTRETTVPVIAELEASYDYVVVDTPPVGLFGDALVFAEATDGAFVVLGASQNDEESIDLTLSRLRDTTAPCLGVVLNRA